MVPSRMFRRFLATWTPPAHPARPHFVPWRFLENFFRFWGPRTASPTRLASQLSLRAFCPEIHPETAQDRAMMAAWRLFGALGGFLGGSWTLLAHLVRFV